jgi:chemotaxis protein CheX
MSAAGGIAPFCTAERGRRIDFTAGSCTIFPESRPVRATFVDAFADAAVAVAAERLGKSVRRGPTVHGSPSHVVAGMAALVGLTGELQGRLMLDLDPLAVSAMAGTSGDDRLVVAGIAEEVTGRALGILRSAGMNIEATPPMVFTGRNLEVTNSRMETVAVSIRIPEGTLVVSLAAREEEPDR